MPHPRTALPDRRDAAVLLWLPLLATAAGCAHTVLVQTEPPGATISVNGREIGTSPISFKEERDPELSEHVITARLNGFETTVKRVRRTRANPWSAFAVAPCCGGLGFAAAGVSFIGGLLLGIPTLGCAIIPGTAAAAIFAGSGCGWMLLTSPTLLLLLRAQTLPDVVRIELIPSGRFEQHDSGTGSWPPYIWSPEEEGYWQNPSLELEAEPVPLPPAVEVDDAGSHPSREPPSSAPASVPGLQR